MNPLSLANHVVLLAGGSIDGNQKPLTNSERWGVTIAGIGVVLCALALLVLVIFLFGKIFERINAKQKAKEMAVAEQKKAKPSAIPAKKSPAPAKTKPASVPTAAAQETDDDEVIAVIAAVVAMMSEQDGKAYKVKSVKAVPKNSGFSGRSAWAMDGRRQNVSPF